MALGRGVWQLGTGDSGRDCWPLMRQYDVALIGPGDAGRYPDRDTYTDEPDVRRFAEAPEGDIVVARQGTRHALGVGLLGEYGWSEAFDDVGGWNLQHYRRVRWWEPPGGPHEFDGRPLAQRRFCACRKVDAWLERVCTERELSPDRDYRALPSIEPPLPSSEMTPCVRRIIKRAKLFQGHWTSGRLGRTPAEAELLTHVTVPLLRALDWRPEQIAIEWEHTDIALFTDFPREGQGCKLVIEGKRIGQGLDFARDQARGYLNKLEVAGSADFMVTDGIQYRLFQAREDYDPDRSLYANLARPKRPAKKLLSALKARA